VTDDEGLEGSRVPLPSGLTGLRSDATENIAVRIGEFERSSMPLGPASSKSFSGDEQILKWVYQPKPIMSWYRRAEY